VLLGKRSLVPWDIDNILPSHIAPKTVNGLSMTPLGKVPIAISLGQARYGDDLHIYLGIAGALLSWKVARDLGIWPPHYPQPIPQTNQSYSQVCTAEVNHSTTQDLVDQYPTVFDGQIRVMEGESFHITLLDNAVPFCVKSSHSIPFTHRDKLKAELDLLQEQGIIAPVTEVTEWCAPIMVTPKKGTDHIRMCVDLSLLNCYVQRECYQSPTPAEAVANIASSEAKHFTIIGAAKDTISAP